MCKLINKFNLGDVIDVDEYGIVRGLIVGIDSHFNAGNTVILCHDYDILYKEDNEFTVQHISEQWINTQNGGDTGE